nr:cation diffusion facilitator family 1 [Agaricus crocodilinus]
MGLSRSTRITLLLIIDVLFFFIELIAGYAVGSLALVADSFHMLNDVLSLIVALYAIKLSASDKPDSRYTYGWHRAEILAALVNGVFLLALCFSIFMEALERFFKTPEISSPRLVVIVGSFGLASNIVGLFLFHEHPDREGKSKSQAPAVASSSTPSPGDIPPRANSRSSTPPLDATYSYATFIGHPVATRASLVQTAEDMARARSVSPESRHRGRRGSDADQRLGYAARSRSGSMTERITREVTLTAGEETPLLQNMKGSPSTPPPKAGSMNMHALVLHVMGDALGNIGVIATGLVIWKTTWSFRFYFDPIISLVITVIIFWNALPLVRSTSFILLQGVPSTISLDEVRSSILAVPGVTSLHELHVWQLSESKIVASVHVLAERQLDFMHIASSIRRVLHHLGIHSSTIQPEYIQTSDRDLKYTNETPCLIQCPPEELCDPQNTCCPPPSADV